MPTIFEPRYTQVPNELLDDWMCRASSAEFKVALTLARATFGWHQEWIELSVQELARRTGLGEKAVRRAIHGLVHDHVVRSRPAPGRSSQYSPGGIPSDPPQKRGGVPPPKKGRGHYI